MERESLKDSQWIVSAMRRLGAGLTLCATSIGDRYLRRTLGIVLTNSEH